MHPRSPRWRPRRGRRTSPLAPVQPGGDQAALYLAGRGAGDLVHHVDDLWHLEVRQRRPAAGPQLRRVRLPLQDHGGAHHLPVLVVVDPETYRVADRRMRLQRVLDLARRDVLTAADDQLLDPALEAEVAVFQQAAVAGAEPAAEEGFGVRLRIAQIAGGEPRAADRHLAGLPGREVPPGLVDDADLRPGRDAHR